ncbi:predicted coding region AF_1555 [Archaeoglobus fulgidus DSM 4304]|uniref:Uncharacterized protein AF_1555 n=1 Tax=Archaeoglobus fulgidus (strain ATCC 49558 / DSM 4304 / JCM 9628 / NBRC 100126 / VC-16) TaxID=224325 RepID=Y1555_ARCFU|nr:RecName: Full=Uncharacterized protein AF_1555 [Archaeoglobus fulgidus DSM 4304]AAB89700.1 predicted coding region AF_1555 [Archaeoglobus fulgidus DSM 4304]
MNRIFCALMRADAARFREVVFPCALLQNHPHQFPHVLARLEFFAPPDQRNCLLLPRVLVKRSLAAKEPSKVNFLSVNLRKELHEEAKSSKKTNLK